MNRTTYNTFPILASSGPGFTLKALPALLLSCFVAAPLFAQTAAPSAPAPVQGAAPARAPVPTGASTPATPSANKSGDAGKDATTGTPQPQAGATDEMATVEVVAARPTNKVDRDVYELKNDISLSNASAADVLNNVPSVTVDQDGTVALRGSPNVQIMVNGKRDAQFQGQNRGDALNSFPAEAIESIEVINVPGAEFGNEGGSGPIINLVLKRNRKPGSRASLSTNKGTEERYNAFANGEYAAGPYSISGNIGVRKDLLSTHRKIDREDLDPQTGDVISTTHTLSDRRTPSQSVTLASTLTYNVGERDQAGATVSYSNRKSESPDASSTLRFGRDMTPIADFSTYSRSRSPAENFGVGASYLHRSGEPGEELKFDARYTGQKNNSDSDLMYDYRVPARVVANNHRATDRDNRILDLTVDYQRVMWETWQLKAGAKYADSKNSNATDYRVLNPLTGAYEPVPSRISDFETNDRNAAIYGILSTKLFDDLRLQGGVRGEYTELDVRQPLINQENKYHYMNWLPSFYATYGVGEKGQLQLRTSRRIARPNEADLNPNLVYVGEFNARQGNPNLEPVNNDSYELAYRDRIFDVDSSVTLFKRLQSPVISYRSYPLATDPNVLVTSPVNFGANDSVGVNLNFNVRRLFLQGLSTNVDATISNEKRMRVFNLSNNTTAEQSNRQETIKLRLSYQFDAEWLQLTVNRRGASLNGQGITKPVTITNFTWLHRLSPRMSLNLNVNNVFNKGNTETFTENEVLRVHTLAFNQPRIFSLGLRYQWGGVTGDERIRNGAMRQNGMFRAPKDGEGGGLRNRDNGGDGGNGGGFNRGGGRGF